MEIIINLLFFHQKKTFLIFIRKLKQQPQKWSPQNNNDNYKSCPIVENTNWNHDDRAKYRTDPNRSAFFKFEFFSYHVASRFLIPVFTYGPNNQLHGFRESIFMAIKLNRTIVTPAFYKHSRNDATSSDDGDAVVPSYLRLGIFYNA